MSLMPPPPPHPCPRIWHVTNHPDSHTGRSCSLRGCVAKPATTTDQAKTVGIIDRRTECLCGATTGATVPATTTAWTYIRRGRGRHRGNHISYCVPVVLYFLHFMRHSLDQTRYFFVLHWISLSKTLLPRTELWHWTCVGLENPDTGSYVYIRFLCLCMMRTEKNNIYVSWRRGGGKGQ